MKSSVKSYFQLIIDDQGFGISAIHSLPFLGSDNKVLLDYTGYFQLNVHYSIQQHINYFVSIATELLFDSS